MISEQGKNLRVWWKKKSQKPKRVCSFNRDFKLNLLVINSLIIGSEIPIQKAIYLQSSPLLPFYGGNARIRFRLDCQNGKDESNSIYFTGFFHFAIRTFMYKCIYHFICQIHGIGMLSN